MADWGRNQRCECGSGRKAKRCCGVRRGPSDTEMAKAFLAGLVTPAAVVLRRFSTDEVDELLELVMHLPRFDSSLQVAVPRLVTPDVEALLRAVDDEDTDATGAALPAVLARVDTPLERARLARAVTDLSGAGRIPPPVAAAAHLDLACQELSSLVASGVVQSAAVVVGAARTPGGLLIAS